MLKYLSDGIADAAEVRCALHLVSNQPELARLSAYKSLFVGLVSSLFATSILYMVGDELAPLISPDRTIQRMMIEIFPLIGMGHIVFTTGIISWALVGAQGRYNQATVVQFICNWGVTIPLSAIFTYGLRIDLQGLTSAFVLGLALSGAGNTYILIRSQWQRLATIISEENQIDKADLQHYTFSSAARTPRPRQGNSSSWIQSTKRISPPLQTTSLSIVDPLREDLSRF
jgi:Na+-driven multidrug efflux pump